MNKTAIKNYAIWARVNLIEAVKQKAFEYEITENGEMKTGIDSVGGRLLSKAEKEQRNTLIAQIRQKGFNQVMEEVAYTWFNRFIALRFMEVNGYLPSKVRIFTDENGAFKPEILKEATRVELDGIDRDTVIHLLDKQDNEGLYKYLLITQCNALNAALPGMFEKIANYTELLFPNNLLKQDSVIGRMISDIPEEDWTDAVQIIGWLYQYYNSELKDETFALLKKNVKITKERIPAATQLFTPDWIVRYMVENSLGRLWYEGHKNDELKSTWKYYLDEAEQEPEVEEQLKKIRAEYAQIKPEDIKVIDPCMGSGHILVYAFDVLMQIYTSAGWSERDAAKSILENNLYGLDIDDRAGQLAYFAVMMKARKYNRRILTMGLKPWVMSIQDSGFMTDDLIEYVANRNSDIRADLRLLRKDFKDAKELGSIINVTSLNYPALNARLAEIKQDFPEDLLSRQYRNEALEWILPLIHQAEIMLQKYDVVVTNPPYMGRKSLNTIVGAYLSDHFPDGKTDLYSAFIIKSLQYTKRTGYTSMITVHTWMFISSFKNLREKVLNSSTIVNMLHSGASTFEEVNSFNVLATAFVLFGGAVDKYLGTYMRLSQYYSEKQKLENYNNPNDRFYLSQDKFHSIQDQPIVYWLSDNTYSIFENENKIERYGILTNGLFTCDNNRFVRNWFEVIEGDIGFGYDNPLKAQSSNRKWFPYDKGGNYRKWYGNNENVVYYKNNGKDIREFRVKQGQSKRFPGEDYHFKPGITWSPFGFENFGVRYKNCGNIFDIAGSSLFAFESSTEKYVLAFLASKVGFYFLSAIAPTVNFQIGNIASLPLIISDNYSSRIAKKVDENINLARQDWDSFETSWDFKKHPLI